MRGDTTLLHRARPITRRRLFAGMCASAALCVLPERVRADFISLAPVAYVVDDESGFEQALSYASRLTRSALVYVGAQWCPVCQTIERRTLQHHHVSALLQSIALVKIDVTAMNADSKALLYRFAVIGPPTLFVVETASGREYANKRMVGKVEPSELVHHLRTYAT